MQGVLLRTGAGKAKRLRTTHFRAKGARQGYGFEVQQGPLAEHAFDIIIHPLWERGIENSGMASAECSPTLRRSCHCSRRPRWVTGMILRYRGLAGGCGLGRWERGAADGKKVVVLKCCMLVGAVGMPC